MRPPSHRPHREWRAPSCHHPGQYILVPPPGCPATTPGVVPEPLGMGGQGICYYAEDPNSLEAHLPDRRPLHVVLKFFWPFANDKGREEQFLQEVLFAVESNHPNLLRATRLLKEEQGWLRGLVTPYYDRSLQDVFCELQSTRLPPGFLDPETAWIIARDVAAGIVELDENDRVHRDLVPTNIAVSYLADQPWPGACHLQPRLVKAMIADLSTVCKAGETPALQVLPRQGDFARYVAPELRGEVNYDRQRKADRTWDVFAVGELLRDLVRRIPPGNVLGKCLEDIAVLCQDSQPARRPSPAQLLVWIVELRNGAPKSSSSTPFHGAVLEACIPLRYHHRPALDARRRDYRDCCRSLRAGGIFPIVGSPGTGKSAFLHDLIQKTPKALAYTFERLHHEDPNEALRVVTRALATTWAFSLPQRENAVDAFAEALNLASQKVADKSECLLVFDALDQCADPGALLVGLPRVLPVGVILIFGTRPLPYAQWQTWLGRWNGPRVCGRRLHAWPLDLDALADEHEELDVAHAYLTDRLPALEGTALAWEAARLARGNFYVLEALTRLNLQPADRLPDFARLLVQTPPGALLRKSLFDFWDPILSDSGGFRQHREDLATLLAVLRVPWPEVDLEQVFATNRSDFSGALDTLAPLVFRESRGISFRHPVFAHYLRGVVAPNRLSKAHEAVATFLLRKAWKSWPYSGLKWDFNEVEAAARWDWDRIQGYGMRYVIEHLLGMSQPTMGHDQGAELSARLLLQPKFFWALIVATSRGGVSPDDTGVLERVIDTLTGIRDRLAQLPGNGHKESIEWVLWLSDMLTREVPHVRDLAVDDLPRFAAPQFLDALHSLTPLADGTQARANLLARIHRLEETLTRHVGHCALKPLRLANVPKEPPGQDRLLGAQAVGPVASISDHRIAFASGEGVIRVWDLNQRRAAPTEFGIPGVQISALLPLGNTQLVMGTREGHVALFDPFQQSPQGQLWGKEGFPPVTALLDLGQGMLGVGDTNGTVYVGDLSRRVHYILTDSAQRGSVTALARVVHGEQTFLAVAAADPILLIWDLQNTPKVAFRLAVAPYFGIGRAVTALATLEDGRLVSADDRGLLTVWKSDREGMGPQFQFRAADEGILAMVPVGSARLAVAHAGGRIRWVDLAGLEGSLLGESSGHGGGTTHLAVCGNALVSVGADAAVRVWSLPSVDWAPAPTQPNTVPRGRRTSIVVYKDRWLIALDASGKISVCDLEGDPSNEDISLPHYGSWRSWLAALWARWNGNLWPEWPPPAVRTLAYLGGTHVATAGGGQLCVWDLSAPRWPVQCWLDEERLPVTAVSSYPGHHLAVVRGGQVLEIQNRSPEGSTWTRFDRFSGHVSLVQANDLGVVLLGGRAGAVAWHPSREREDLQDAHGDVRALAMLDSQGYGVGYADGTIRLWRSGNGTRPRILKGHRGAVSALHYLGSDLLASAGEDGIVWLWNIQNGESEARFSLDHGVTALTAIRQSSETPRRLVAYDDRATPGLHLWSL